MRRIVRQLALVAACLLAAATTPASAQRIVYVDDDGPADFDTIQAAIDAASDGDTVLIASGTYTGDGNRDIDFKGKAISVRSQDGPRGCAIDCQGSEAEPHRGFYFHSGEDANSVLEGVSIVHGYAHNGGGICCWGASPRIVGCAVLRNTALFAGGGISVSGSHAQIANCIVSENEAGEDGGGISCGEGQPIDIRNCTIINNRAGVHGGWSSSGGGIVFGSGMGEVLVHNTIIWDNQAPRGTQLALINCGSVVGCVKPTVRYCCVEPGPNSTAGGYQLAMNGVFETNHNITDDPLLVLGSDGDCQLRSQAGRWDPNSASWILDDVTSPCIDAGDPDSGVGSEPSPNGGVINIGAYGGTAEASKSYPRSSAVLYVDGSAAVAGDGSSWANAYRYLQDALAAARHSETPAEIRVAQGYYKPDHGIDITRGDRGAVFHLSGGMTLTGGYAGGSCPDPNARDVDLYETVLSGDLKGDDTPPRTRSMNLPTPTRTDNSHTLVVMEGNRVAPCVLDGFRVDSASGSAAVEIGLVYPYVRNCTFINNISRAVSLTAAGACPEFTDCQFLRNTALNGSAICVGADLPDQTPTTVTVEGCIFRENHATEEGGAIVLRACDASYIRDCLFVGNTARFGGAIFLDAQETVHVANCILAGNRATETGGGIYLHSWDVDVRCCTFAGNRARYGRAIETSRRLYDIDVINSILRDDGSELLDARRIPFPVTSVTYSNIEQWAFGGEGNIDVDPLFADPGYWDANGTPDDPSDDFFVEGDYHLKSQTGRWDPDSASWVADDVTSPCIDAGDPDSPIGDEPTPNGGIINMGAYGGTVEASKSVSDVGAALD